jgi:hypothetical protein
MIELPRALARQFRAVLRRCLSAQESRGAWPLLLCQAGQEGLILQARVGDIAVRLRQAGERPADAVAFRAALLAECEGNTPDPVTLESVAFGKGQARWQDGEDTRTLDFETVTPDSVPPFPVSPEKFTELPDSFLVAFQEACLSAARESVRFGIARVQLRGRRGAVVGTDGRQLLVWGGFVFPWKEEVLVPRLPVFGFRDTSMAGPVAIGRTEKDVTLRVGLWTLALAIDATSRYPQVDRVIPQEGGVKARLQLHPADAALLHQALPKLPGRETDHAPVTLELGPTVAVRARADDGPVSELPLSRSVASGRPVRLCTDRTYLRRAAQLGFPELQVTGPDQPVCCRDQERVYLWVPLSPDTALPPAEGAMPVPSDGKDVPAPQPPNERRNASMTKPPNNGNGNGSPTGPAASRASLPAREETPPNGIGVGALIAEAQALKEVLRDGYERANRLLAALKRHGKQSELLRSTLASLRQLQGLSG